MSSCITPASPHIPAWKKVGLRLKNAKVKESDDASPATSGPIPHVEVDGNSRSGKAKRKSQDVTTAAEPSQSSHRSAKRLKNTNDSIDPSITSSQPIAERSPERRKSVSFSADTKKDDGDSVKAFKKRLATSESRSSSDLGGNVVSSLKTSKKKGKVHAKPYPEQISKQGGEAGSQSSQPYLEYLSAYQDSRATWKFSKPLQNQLFKHILSPDSIRSSYDTALISYLEGLQSAGARQRLREQAHKVIEEDESWLSEKHSPDQDIHPDRRKAMDVAPDIDRHARLRDAYRAEVSRQRQYLLKSWYEDHQKALEADRDMMGMEEETRPRLGKRKRAELLLYALSKGDKSNVSSSKEEKHQTLIRNSNQMLGRDSERLKVTPVKSRGKKTVFDDHGSTNGGAQIVDNATNGLNGVNGAASTAEEGRKRRKRRGKKKRNNRRTGAPDDDDTSSDDSSSDSDIAQQSERGAQSSEARDGQRKVGVGAASLTDASSGRSEGSSDDTESSKSESEGESDESDESD